MGHTSRAYAAVSLFSGCGGMDLGAEATGKVKTVWAVDNEHWAVETYRRNIGPHIVEGDITTIDVPDVACDILLAGPPCQDYSTLWNHDGLMTARGNLFREVSRFLAVLQPAAFVLENVGQSLLCANEGVLRDAIDDLDDGHLGDLLDEALRSGAARSGSVTVVNLNRQRPTSEAVWKQIVEYVSRKELWQGCEGCPFDLGGCAMRSNADRLRDEGVQAQVRLLLRLASGDAVPTIREVLSVLSWALVGDQTCESVKVAERDIGPDSRVATNGYFTRIVGGGLTPDLVDRSPLMSSLRRSGLGVISDLEVDAWLRDASGASLPVRRMAGAPLDQGQSDRSCLTQVRTKQGVMSFYALGEMVSTDEDSTRVEDGLDALVSPANANDASGLTLWRQRAFFEVHPELGGQGSTARRLIKYRHIPGLVGLAQRVSRAEDYVLDLNEIVVGLNYLVTGFSSPNEGLIVPDPSCLFSRDPGSFRPARPSLVHSQIDISRLSLQVPDRGLVEEILDVDHIDVVLLVDSERARSLSIRPRMYEAIKQAAEYRGPVGQGVAEMNDLRAFYGDLASETVADSSLRVADPSSRPPALVKVVLPYFRNGDTE